MIDKNTIPKHWEIKKMGDVCKLKNGFAFKSTDYHNIGVPVIRISDINNGIVSSENAVRINPESEFENYTVELDDILVAMSGATTGKFGVYRDKAKAYQNQRVGKFKILDTRILDNQFLFYHLNSLKRQIEKDAYGGAQPNISSSKIEEMDIAIPPLSEQQQIVSKIEELFSELDKGKQQLETVKQQLKSYRQAVLKWAFEGRFTNNNIKDGQLPEGWKWVKVGEVVDSMKNGIYKPADIYSEDGIACLRMYNIEKGKIAWYDIKRMKLNQSEVEEYQLIEGDLLINRVNSRELVGKTAYIKSLDEPLVYESKNIRLRLKKNNNGKYLNYWFLLSANKYFTSNAQQTVGMASINQKQISNFEFPSPKNVEMQKVIVQEIETRLSVCDKMEETIENSLRQVESLRQSILKQAFEGKLL